VVIVAWPGIFFFLIFKRYVICISFIYLFSKSIIKFVGPTYRDMLHVYLLYVSILNQLLNLSDPYGYFRKWVMIEYQPKIQLFTILPMWQGGPLLLFEF